MPEVSILDLVSSDQICRPTPLVEVLAPVKAFSLERVEQESASQPRGGWIAPFNAPGVSNLVFSPAERCTVGELSVKLPVPEKQGVRPLPAAETKLASDQDATWSKLLEMLAIAGVVSGPRQGPKFGWYDYFFLTLFAAGVMIDVKTCTAPQNRTGAASGSSERPGGPAPVEKRAGISKGTAPTP